MFLKRLIKESLHRVGYDITRLPQSISNPPHTFLEHEPFSDIIQLSGIHPVRTVFDVGANAGQTAATLAKDFPESTIYSFEPCPEAFDRLRSATKKLSNVLPFNLALGDQTLNATLFLNQDSATNSLLQNSASLAYYADNAEGVTPIGSTTVPVIRLDTFCSQKCIDLIDLLKIDTQGYELKVLEGAGRLLDFQRIRFIYLEVLFVSLYEQQTEFWDLCRKLASHGYRFVGLYGLVRDTKGFLKWSTALFMAEQSAA